jgi:hypothetical protein
MLPQMKIRNFFSGFSPFNKNTAAHTTNVARPPYAFLSYSRRDQGVVRQLAAYLAQEEIPPWVDNQLEYGEAWEQIIVQRIKDCTVFLIAMSPESKQSAYVSQEVDLALSLHKLIVPILISGEPFPQLSPYQFVNLLDTDKSQNRFIERMRQLLTPDQIPNPPASTTQGRTLCPRDF